MGKSRKLVCRNSPAGITLWSRPSSTPSKRKYLSSHTNINIKWFRLLDLHPSLFITVQHNIFKWEGDNKKCENCTGWLVFGHTDHKDPRKLDNRKLVSLAGISKQVVLQNMSSSFCLKTTLLWLRPLTCWQSGSSRWVRSRPQEILLCFMDLELSWLCQK